MQTFSAGDQIAELSTAKKTDQISMYYNEKYSFFGRSIPPVKNKTNNRIFCEHKKTIQVSVALLESSV